MLTLGETICLLLSSSLSTNQTEGDCQKLTGFSFMSCSETVTDNITSLRFPLVVG